MTSVELRPPKSLSPSGIANFEKCPLSYWLDVTIKPIEPVTLPSAVLGTFVHSVLEFVYKLPDKERDIDHARLLARDAYDLITQTPQFASLHFTEDQAKAFRWQGWELIQKYFALENPKEVNAVGMELWVRSKIGDVTIRGIIDRLDIVNGTIEIADYKTGKVPNPRYAQDRMHAMHIYSLLTEKILGVRPEKLKLLYLAGPKMVEATPTTRSTNKTEKHILSVTDQIMSRCLQGGFEPTPNKLCDWCGWKESCPAWGGNLDLLIETSRLTGALKVGAPLRPVDEEPPPSDETEASVCGQRVVA